MDDMGIADSIRPWTMKPRNVPNDCFIFPDRDLNCLFPEFYQDVEIVGDQIEEMLERF